MNDRDEPKQHDRLKFQHHIRIRVGTYAIFHRHMFAFNQIVNLLLGGRVADANKYFLQTSLPADKCLIIYVCNVYKLMRV